MGGREVLQGRIHRGVVHRLAEGKGDTFCGYHHAAGRGADLRKRGGKGSRVGVGAGSVTPPEAGGGQW